jgi:hypothetical protein
LGLNGYFIFTCLLNGKDKGLLTEGLVDECSEFGPGYVHQRSRNHCHCQLHSQFDLWECHWNEKLEEIVNMVCSIDEIEDGDEEGWFQILNGAISFSEYMFVSAHAARHFPGLLKKAARV